MWFLSGFYFQVWQSSRHFSSFCSFLVLVQSSFCLKILPWQECSRYRKYQWFISGRNLTDGPFPFIRFTQALKLWQVTWIVWVPHRVSGTAKILVVWFTIKAEFLLLLQVPARQSQVYYLGFGWHLAFFFLSFAFVFHGMYRYGTLRWTITNLAERLKNTCEDGNMVIIGEHLFF